MQPVLALLLAAGIVSPNRPSVALMPLRPLGVPADVVRALEVTLRNELERLPEAKMVPEKELTAALKASEAECEAKPACAATAAAKTGAREFISGTTSQLGDSFMIDLKLVDARSAQEVRRATYPVKGSQDGLIETLREAAVRLLAPSRFVGALTVEVPGAPGAAIFVDGRPAGTLPLSAPIEGLSPGQHTLRVQDGKAREMSTFVEVRFAQTTDAHIDLAATPMLAVVPAEALPTAVAVATSNRPRWVRPAAIAGLSAGLVATVAAVAFQAKAYATASDLNRREQSNELRPSDLAAYQDVSRNTHIARGLYVTAAVLAVAGGALLYWDLRSDGASVQGKF